MAKLYFKFGAMDSSKTANALMTRFNYQEKGKTVWLIKPATDTRDGVATVKSRIGLEAEATVIPTEGDIIEMLPEGTDVIICDECQFLSPQQVDQLRIIVSEKNIPVLCYGLRGDFQTHLFPGSRRLFELADSIAEIKSICRCGAKATVNARFDESGHVVTEGDQVVLGGNSVYEGMCWSCWHDMIKNNKTRYEKESRC